MECSSWKTTAPDLNNKTANFLDQRLPSRFWDKVQPEPNSGCWLWTGATTNHGYGSFRVRGRMRIAHRVAVTELVQPIEMDMVVDHLCRNRGCVNPAHLDVVTMAENTARGFNADAVAQATRDRAASMTECFRGHALTDGNVIKRSNGGRSCRACTNMRKRKYRLDGAVSRGLVTP